MRIVLADLKGSNGFVNKDTVVGGFGLRFKGWSFTTRWIERARNLFQNVPSVHAAYIAAILEREGHEVVYTNDAHMEGDVALVLSSLVDYRREIAWACLMLVYGVGGVLLPFVGIKAIDLLLAAIGV